MGEVLIFGRKGAKPGNPLVGIDLALHQGKRKTQKGERKNGIQKLQTLSLSSFSLR